MDDLEMRVAALEKNVASLRARNAALELAVQSLLVVYEVHMQGFITDQENMFKSHLELLDDMTDNVELISTDRIRTAGGLFYRAARYCRRFQNLSG
jgi:hypothetical protein